MGEVIEIEEAVQEPWPLAEEIIKKAANAQWPHCLEVWVHPLKTSAFTALQVTS
jgi:hypothetical protein